MAEAPKSFAKLKALQEIEAKAQQRWEAEKMFEVDAPEGKSNVEVPNLSKAEFAVAFERLKGKRALFPFGFHCTGMPIKACADKLKREVELFGKNFEGWSEESEVAIDLKEAQASGGDTAKVVKKHSKVAAKSGDSQYQFQIMLSMGVAREEIHKFQDPIHWLYFFPPLAIADMKALGTHVDWRRAFITTDVNKYFDSFVRWQFNTLKNQPSPKVKFGERYTIYSPLDGQPCMDHDRASGEGVGVQEYTCVKLEVLLHELNATPVAQRATIKDVPVGEKLTAHPLWETLKDKKVYLVAATFRPETMYGQTSCYVGVDLEYGLYEASPKEVYVCTERAAKNMAFQGIFAQRGEI
ncbi:hypothetical protein BC829DRAFT_448053, partial [Chytridium lagenaria]